MNVSRGSQEAEAEDEWSVRAAVAAQEGALTGWRAGRQAGSEEAGIHVTTKQ